MGVKLNQFGKPVAYFLFKEHPHNTQFGTYDRTHTEVPAEDIIHAYQPERPEQTRGLPFMTTALNRLKMLDGYEEAESYAKKLVALNNNLDPRHMSLKFDQHPLYLVLTLSFQLDLKYRKYQQLNLLHAKT